MPRAPLALLLLAACKQAPPPASEPQPAAPQPPASPPAEPPASASGALTLSPSPAPLGAEVTVTFDRPGSDGCYRQTEPTLALAGATYTFAYTTSREGEVCTMALVPGGFTAPLKPVHAGTWTVAVQVDGVTVASEALVVTPAEGG